MYTKCIVEERLNLPGEFYTKEHLIKGTVRRPSKVLPSISSYEINPNACVLAQLNNMPQFDKSLGVFTQDKFGNCQFWTKSEKDPTKFELNKTQEKFLSWALITLAGTLIDEYLSAVFYNDHYTIERVNRPAICDSSKPMSVVSQFTISTPTGNRYNLVKYTNGFEGQGSTLNTDNIIREYRVNVYAQYHDGKTAKSNLFIYLPINKVLQTNLAYDVSQLINRFNLLQNTKQE